MSPRKKKFDPPVSIWVIYDIDTKHPLVVFEDPDEAAKDVNADGSEVIVHYTLPKTKGA